ncbi:MAG: AmmeMemoRadiSam system radical SAM enzyme [Patescibacteria group bacterium]
MKQAILFKKLENKKVQCLACNHRCTILPDNRGICAVRQNQDGNLVTLVYGKAISEAVDPIEKKPLFHFLPGSTSLSIATIGCNFRCDNCQNWQISQGSKNQSEIPGRDLSPAKIVADAKTNHCLSISYTYTEPTIFVEYALDTMKLAKQSGLKNVWVSNGYMTRETLEEIRPYLDAINVDLKFFDNASYQKNCGGRLDPILENLKWFKQNQIHLEVTTLSIPTLSDSMEMLTQMARFIKEQLGPETPWHLSAFSPDISYKLEDLSATPVSTLEKARTIALEQGLKFVYLGNVPGHQGEQTYCPECGIMVIQRLGYQTNRYDEQGQCPKCQANLALVLK